MDLFIFSVREFTFGITTQCGVRKQYFTFIQEFLHISGWQTLMEMLRSSSAVCYVVMAHMKQQSPCSGAEIVQLSFGGCEGT